MKQKKRGSTDADPRFTSATFLQLKIEDREHAGYDGCYLNSENSKRRLGLAGKPAGGEECHEEEFYYKPELKEVSGYAFIGLRLWWPAEHEKIKLHRQNP